MNDSYNRTRARYWEGYEPEPESENEVVSLRKQAIDAVLGLERISKEETEELIAKMREAEGTGNYKDSIQIRNRIIEGNLRLVLKFVGQYSFRYKKDISDMISVGGVGMMLIDVVGPGVTGRLLPRDNQRSVWKPVG